eukprot:g52295.t1
MAVVGNILFQVGSVCHFSAQLEIFAWSSLVQLHAAVLLFLCTSPSAEATAESEQEQEQEGGQGSEGDDGQGHDVDEGLVSEDS